MSSDDFDREYLLLNKAFKKARENENTIVGGLNLISLRPDPTITSDVILRAAKDQHEWSHDTEVSVLRSNESISATLTEQSIINEED